MTSRCSTRAARLQESKEALSNLKRLALKAANRQSRLSKKPDPTTEEKAAAEPEKEKKKIKGFDPSLRKFVMTSIVLGWVVSGVLLLCLGEDMHFVTALYVLAQIV